MREKRFFYVSLAVLCLSLAFAVVFQSLERPAVAGERTVSSPLAEQLQNEFSAVAAKVNPTVVAIDVAKEVPRGQLRIPFRFPFEDFFDMPGAPWGQPRRQQPQQQQRRQPQQGEVPKMRGAGSGVIIDADEGYILTNNHVVGEADEISVTLIDGRKVPGKLVGADPRTDIAVVQIEAEGLQAIEWGDSDKLEVGHWVLAFGQPEGLRYTVTTGIVSAKGRVNLGIIGAPGGITGYEDFIQTDAAINPGNSGGPLTNVNGELVGINTAIATAGIPAFMGIGFAVPANLAQRVADQLIEKGEVVRGWLGVSIGDFKDTQDDALKEIAGHAKDDYGDLASGVLVAAVQAGQPAEKAGLRAGDVIIGYNGLAIENVNELRALVADTVPGKTVAVKFVRIEDGEPVEKSLEVEIAKQPEDLSLATAAPGVVDTGVGMSVQTLTPEMADAFEYGVDAGAVVTEVEEGSRAAEADIRPGDVITEVRYRGEATQIQSAGDLEKVLSAIPAGESFVVARNRAGRTMFVTVK